MPQPARLYSLRVESLELRRMLDSTTVLNEIMYHPARDEDPEWIELFNEMSVDMDLSGWKLGGGVEFRFPQGTVLAGGGYLAVSSDPDHMPAMAGGLKAMGPFVGRLSNGGDLVELRDNNDRLMSSVEYGDQGAWPVGPDGSGASLARFDAGLASEAAAGWASSAQVGGTPGAANTTRRPGIDPAPLALAINEIGPATPGPFWLELVNFGDQPLDLGGVTIVSRGDQPHRLVLPSQTLSPGEYRQLDEAALGFGVAGGDSIFLLAADGTSVLDAVDVADRVRGRLHPAGGQWLYPDVPTPGQPNHFSLSDAIVINEIMYHGLRIPGSQGTPATYGTSAVVAFDSTWRYGKAFTFGDADQPYDAGQDWDDVVHAVDGLNWSERRAPFGFLRGRSPLTIGTRLASPAVNSNYITTYYFENDFTLAQSAIDGMEGLLLRYLVDDGAVFYLNGQEVSRFNMPAGTPNVDTLASSDVGSNQLAVSDYVEIPKSLLVAEPSVNRLSVEVHQSSRTSEDVAFAAELAARELINPGFPSTPYGELAEEWIELYNRSGRAVDLTEWTLGGDIQYAFPPGTTLMPDSYLVVANDAARLRAKYPTRSNIIGDLDGNLPNGDGRIVLVDAADNPADEVHYFDGGHWDQWADGYGPSLELQDPQANNAKGEAWLASDEASKSLWQTYTYRGVAQTTITGEPTLWHELAFGMLDGAGEVLVDDIHVIEDPDGEALERIPNGSFDGGSSDHWRLLGNHQRSEVVNDGGNFVLHVVADGATEYQGNQIETTFADRARIKNGTQYEISFRAKWLAGSRQINSRLYFNRLAKTTVLEVPDHNGTPGLPNSRRVANLGPTFDQLRHEPVIPEPKQPVTVSVEAADPQGIREMDLWYRIDDGPWASAPMAAGPGSLYAGVIPGNDAGQIVQFYVRATDREGAVSLFPAAGPQSRALWIVDDGRDKDGPLHSLRLIMTDADADQLHDANNVLSNQRIGATVVYDGQMFYDAAVRLKGSFVGRDAARVGFNISFHPDQLFRGVHAKVSVDRSTHAEIGVDEILVKHLASAAGDIPSMYDDLIHFVSPRRQHTGTAALRMAGYDDVYLDSQFNNGTEGTVFEYEVIRWATTTVDGDPESVKRAGGLDDPNGYVNVEFQDLGDDKESYRWTNLIVSNRTRDDYGSIVELGKALGRTGAALDRATRQVLDVDQWMRAAAYQSLVGPADAYFTGSNVHNFRLYVRPDGKVLYLPWDWDSSFQLGNNAPLVGSGKLAQVVRLPANLRLFYGHMLDIIDRSFNRAYMEAWTKHYGELAGRNFASRLSYIDRRAQFAAERVARDFPPIEFSVTTPGPLQVNTPEAMIEGKGWVNVRELRLAGSDQPLDIAWQVSTGSAADSWQIRFPVAFGAHDYTLEAYDFRGNRIASKTITVESTDPRRPIRDFLRVSELFYHPRDSEDIEFIELTNISSGPSAVTLDLTGASITQGPSQPFTFVAGTMLAPGDYLLVVNDPEAFQAAYPHVDRARIAGQYQGQLANSGERLVLVDPYGNTVLDFQYADGEPWPEAADGDGASLVLVDPAGTAAAEYGKFYRWRASSEFGGSPGAPAAEPAGVVINEVLSRPDPTGTASDAIELANISSQPIDIGGWYLSDDSDDLLKYQIPATTVLGPGEYIVFDEDDFNSASGGSRSFALNGTRGDDVWLVLPDEKGGVVTLVDDVHFDATALGESYGRSPDGTGRLTPLVTPTLGRTNSAARDGQIIVSEIQYHPGPPSPDVLSADPAITADDREFLELHNASPAAIGLAGWRIRGGISFDISVDVLLEPRQTLLVLSFDPRLAANANRLAAFRMQYGIGDDISMIGGYEGRLGDDGQLLRLLRPDSSPPESPDGVYVIEDEILYDDLAPWPVQSDGGGDSLHRVDVKSPGGMASSWAAGPATPGSVRLTAAQPGDANVDGVFDQLDLDLVFAAGRYLSHATADWASGDWNGDGYFNQLDIVLALQSARLKQDVP